MSPLNPWIDFMKEEIEWEQLNSSDPYDKYGQPSFSTAVTIKCRIVDKERLTRNIDGQEVVSRTTIYCDGYHGINSNDKIILPNGEHPDIIRINTYPDEMNNKYEQILT